MIDRIVVAAGSVLGVGALLVAAVVGRPRPRSVREVAYLAFPLIGAVVISILAWSRL